MESEAIHSETYSVLKFFNVQNNLNVNSIDKF